MTLAGSFESQVMPSPRSVRGSGDREVAQPTDVVEGPEAHPAGGERAVLSGHQRNPRAVDIHRDLS